MEKRSLAPGIRRVFLNPWHTLSAAEYSKIVSEVKKSYIFSQMLLERETWLKMKVYFILLFLFLLATPNLALAHPGDMNGTVTHVVDGDTFDVSSVNGTKYRIRMADVNAVEFGQARAKLKEHLDKERFKHSLGSY